MKKQLTAFIMVLAITVFSFVIPTIAPGSSASADEIKVSIPVASIAKNQTLMSYEIDDLGNILGPEDFSIDGKNYYVLNSASNTVLHYDNSSLKQAISLDSVDTVGYKISAANDNLYVLGTDLKVTTFTDENNTILDISGYGFDEAISDFRVIGDYLYVCSADCEGGTTYKFDISNTGIKSEPVTFHGRIFDENTIYSVSLNKEEGSLFGHGLDLTVENITTGETNTISLTSDYWMAGAQYLGKDSNNNYIVKVYEMATKPDLSAAVAETLRTINADGETISIVDIAPQEKHIANQIKVFDGELYQLSNKAVSVDIIAPNFSRSFGFDDYISPLEGIVEPVVEERDVLNAASAMTRTQIINNAKAYHLNFSWTCTNANLQALANWKKPPYVTGAGTYSMMPYCWGGNHTPAQFTSGMASGGRVGNINTSYPYWVSNTYGVDCSGYVGRCWNQSTKYGTGTIYQISHSITYANLLRGDALNNVTSHIVLFELTDGYGTFTLYEATTGSWYRVAHTTRPVTELQNSGYRAIRYNDVA